MMQLAPRVWLTPCAAAARVVNHDVHLGQVASTAFGDGSHPTTRLCTHAVDLWCRTRRPESMLDVGTGTGVLARVARARGVARVRGTDIDAEALRAATANAALDDATGAGVPIAVDDASPEARGAFQLVVANILEGPLTQLSSSLTCSVEEGGTLLLSGFTCLQAPRLRLTFERQGLHFAQQAQLEGWCLLRMNKPVVSTAGEA